jgi:GTP-binding protein Era
MHDDEPRALNRYLNRTADTSLLSVDVVVWLLDGLEWQAYDDVIVNKLERAKLPVILAINKIDKVKDQDSLLPFLAKIQDRFSFKHIIPVSALKGNNLPELEALMLSYLPKSELIYPEDQITDRSERFMAAEIIREKLIRRLGQELPHTLTVEIELYQESDSLTKIYAIIWVERNTQKNIVIGKHGAMLKNIGTDARGDIEALIDNKVYLQLWVKVKKGWANNERALQSLGFDS